MVRPKDMPQRKVLLAEADLRDNTAMPVISQRAAALAVNRAVGWAWFKRRRPALTDVTVEFRGNGTCNEQVNNRGIAHIVLPAQPRMVDVAHHLAHFLANAYINDAPLESQPVHGPGFCRAELDLIRKLYNTETAEELKRLFKVHGVKTRTWSPAARERHKGKLPNHLREAKLEDLQALLAELKPQ